MSPLAVIDDQLRATDKVSELRSRGEYVSFTNTMRSLTKQFDKLIFERYFLIDQRTD